MPDNAYVIPDQDSDWVPNRPVPPREPPDGALRRLVESDTYVIPDTPDPKPRSLMGDVGRGFASSAVGTVGVAAGFMEYVFGSGGNLTAAREGLNATAEGIAEGMSPQMKTALGREFTALPSWLGGDSDKSAWEGFGTALGSASAQIVAASGSLISAAPAIIAGAMAGSYAVPAAVVVGAATGGALGGGSVWSEVATEFQKMPEAERMKNPIYAKLRETMDEPSAINQTVREVASGYVNAATAVSGLVGAATGPFLGKLGAGKLGGVWQGAKTGFKSEGLEELADEGSNQFFSEAAGSKLTGREFDSGKVVEGAVRGAIGGGGLGGIMGGLGGLRNTERPAVPAVDPSILAATQNPAGTTSANPAPPSGPAGPATPPTTPPVDPSILGAISANPENRAPTPLPPLDPTAVEPSLVTGAPGLRSGGVDPATGQHLLPMEVEGGMAPPAAAPVAETPEAADPRQSFIDFIMQGLGAADNEAALGLLDRSPKIAAQIRALHESGKNARAIADELNFDEAFVVAALKAIGVAPAPTQAPLPPPTQAPLPPPTQAPTPAASKAPPASPITPPKPWAEMSTAEFDKFLDTLTPAQQREAVIAGSRESAQARIARSGNPLVPRVRKPKKEAAPPTPPESAITPVPTPAPPAGETPLQGDVLPPDADPKTMPPGPQRRVAEARQQARDELVARVRGVVAGSAKLRKTKTRSARAEADLRMMEDQEEAAKIRQKEFLEGVEDSLEQGVEKLILGTRTGMSDEQALTTFVNQLLDEAQKETDIKPLDPRSLSTLTMLLRDRAGALAHDELVHRKVLEDTEESSVGRSTLQRVEKKHILLAAEGDMEAVQRIQARIAATRQSDMGRLFRRINGVLTDAGLATDQEWMKPLAAVGATAKAGGSLAGRAARTAAVEGKKEEVRATAAKTAEQLGAKHAEITAALNGVDPSWILPKRIESAKFVPKGVDLSTKAGRRDAENQRIRAQELAAKERRGAGVNHAIDRWKDAYTAMAKALGVEPNTTAMLRAVGYRKERTRDGVKVKPSDAALLVAFYHELANLEKVTPAVLVNLQAAEAMARGGDPDSARQLVASVKAEAKGTLGTGAKAGEDVLEMDTADSEDGLSGNRDSRGRGVKSGATIGALPDDSNLDSESLAANNAARRAEEAAALTSGRRATTAEPMRLTVEDRGNTRTPDAESEGEPDFVAGKANDGVATQVIRQRTAEEAAADADKKKRREAAMADLRKRNAASGGTGVGTGLGTLRVMKMADAGPTITRRGLLRGVGAAVLSWAMGGKVFAQTVPAAARVRAGDFQGALEAIAKHSPNAGYRALAKRLAPLVKDIPITVVEFEKTYPKGVPAALNRALGTTTLRHKTGEVQVYLRDDPSGKTASGVTDETILHEAIHAALLSRLGLSDMAMMRILVGDKPTPADAHLTKLFDLHRAYKKFIDGDKARGEQVQKEVSLREAYKDFDEFISYATTSPEFQAWMKTQELNKAGMWQRLLDMISGFLGINKDERTYLETVLDATNVMLESLEAVPPRYGATADTTTSVKKQEANNGADDTDGAEGTGEDEYTTKLMAMPTRVQEFFDEQIPKNVSESFLANMVGRLKKVGLGFSTTRQIELMGDSQFERTELMDWMDPDTKGNLLHVAVATHAKRRQLAENRLKEFLDPIRQLMGLDHASERKVSELLVDSSMAEAHPDVDLTDEKNKHLKGKDEKKAQARKNHVGLRARYLTLTKEERDAYHAVVDAAAQAHATAVNSIIHSVVDRWWMDTVAAHLRDPVKNTLPVANKAAVPGFLKGLKNRATSNKLTDDEKLLLGDDWYGLVVKAYARAKMDGPYVPFQRQGEFVVSWVEPAEEFVNFDSQEAVDKFTLETPYNIVRVKERFYNKAGDEILEPDLGIMLDLQGTAISELGDRADPMELGQAMRRATRKALEKTRERDATKTVFEVQQQVQGMAMFETEAEANQAARELRELGRTVDEIDLRAKPADRRSLLQDADFNKLTQAIERDKTMTDEQKAVAIEALQDAMLMVLPNRTLNSSLVKRRKVLGPSRNVRRVMANYGLAVANFTAGVDTGLTISTALSEMARVTNEGRKNAATDSGMTLSRRRILREIETRMLEAPLDNPGTGSRVVRAVQSMAFIHFLASPSYSMIQLTQPWMLTMPILAARFGARSGPAALARATRDIGFGSIMKAGGKDSIATLRTFITGKSGEPQAILEGVRQRLAAMPDGADLNKMLDALSAEGLVDGDAGLELMRAEVTADIWAGRKLGQLEAVARALPAAIEVINRTSSAVAAYRLAVKAGQTHEQAVLTAREVVDQSQADYSSSNTARYMDTRRYPWLAPMMTFRKYAQAVYALLARQVYLSVKGKDKATRRQAMKTLAYVLGTHVAVAGTLGLPTEAITIVLGIVAMALGQDEPWDWEQEVRQAMASVFGKEGAEVLTRGLPRMAGIDLSGRMGLNSLIFINDLKDFDRKSTTEYVGGLLTGAPGAMISAWLGAPAQMAKGDYGRAAEALLPKGARDAIKAMRFNEEGITTKRGERIDSNREFTAGDAIMQGLGFTPAAVAETYERRNAVQGASRRFNNERVGLLRDWRQAKPGDRGDVWTRVQEWNQALPPEGRKERITRANLIASEQEAKRRAKASGGADYLPKGREWMRREGEFANTRER